MVKKSPKVSVLTPIYKTNPQYLRECIDSILCQTFTDFEFIILNDSPEETYLDDIVKSYKDDRIKYFKNEKNLGISESRNKLLDLAKGEYLAIFDHDDISVPNRLELEVNYLDKNPEIGVVSGFFKYFGGNQSGYIWKTPEYDIDIKIMQTRNCYVIHSASMIRKSVLVDNNVKYESYYSPSEDYKLFARLMKFTKFYNIQDVLLLYRHHNNRTTVIQANKMKIMKKTISLEVQNEFPAYTSASNQLSVNKCIFRIKLFGIIPILEIKNNWIYLFEIIPVFKIKFG